MSDTFELKMPHFGEGMHYAKVVNILKGKGDLVEEDSNILIVETDKTSIEVPSPVSGLVSDVFCKVGQTVDVGATMLTIQKNEAKKTNIKPQQNPPHDFLNEYIQPLNLSPLPDKQVSLISAMRKSRDVVIAAQIETRIDWQNLQTARKRLRQELHGKNTPTTLEMICWATVQAIFVHQKFGAKVIQDQLLYHSTAKIGVALSQEEDTLRVAAVSVATEDSFLKIRQELRKSVQAGSEESGYHSIVLSDMSSYGIFSAQPIVVHPAIATLFIGAPYWAPDNFNPRQLAQYSNLVLGFDHRAINGAYAAEFLKSIAKNLKALSAKDSSFFMQ